MIYTATYSSPIGCLLLAEKNHALCGLWLENQKYYLSSIQEKMESKEDSKILILTKQWLDRYFAGERPDGSLLPLSPVGSEFRRQVWDILLQIPYGETTTYKAIARQVAAQKDLPHMSAQAVGGAVGHNPISIIIPCHRVIGTNGSLTGYAGGIEKKRWLLEHEGICKKSPRAY
ncbi:MAG: methylated-DNA--[protein]-cysteine S-methyltransferase [Lachnospiraceae bacterium]|jgi:methylated-DNA-[protein]-cysteine S-methyltransferase|nr:methylated-DNA--[protein]-cysteine S-methyltransferase [Lachnospiraceae bacterium]